MREYEKLNGSKISASERPVFHLTPYIGWMNDPNGFVYFDGKYHLFYQYNPYDVVWGPMHWGHAVSKDLIHWEFLPAAIAPDSKNDKEGCFSGCALELDDGQLALIYTGVRKNKADKSKNVQIQCLAVGDGENFTKNKTAVIESDKVPEGCSIEDFRDPKVVRASDGSFLLYDVNKNEEGKGQVLVYKSQNLKDWEYCGCVLKNDFGLGGMWECPDLFSLDGNSVLMMSAQEVSQSDDFDAGNIGVCLIGKYDEQQHKFVKQSVQQIDRGLDFYAQQTITTPDGRRIMIGWMQNWEICNYRVKGGRWFGQMSVPREITIENGRLFQKPVRELETFRKNMQELKSIKINNNKIVLSELNGNCFDMTITVKKYDTNMSYFAANLFEKDGHYARVYYDFNLEKAGVDRSRAGSKAALLHERSCTYKNEKAPDSELKLRIIADRNSVEVFWGEGELAMSMCIYEENPGQGFSLEAKGSAEIDVVRYEII